MKDFVLVLPEIFLALTLAGVVAGEISYHGERTRLVRLTALLGLAGAFVQTMLTYRFGATTAFGGGISIDGLSLFFKLLFIALAGAAIATSAHSREIRDDKRSEYIAIILGATLAMCLVASAADMLVAFLALQFTNLMSYFLSGYGKRSVTSIEAAIKHLVFGCVAAGLFLYGIAMLFNVTHSINVYEMHRALVSNPMSHVTGLVIFTLIFLSLAFQFSAFPMWLWTPDVLEGAPTPSSAFLSIGPRAAGFALALRLLITVFAQPSDSVGQWQVLGQTPWTEMVALLASLTLVVGSLLALRQESAKRLVAFLVVVTTGQLLVGLFVLDQVGVAAVLYNLVVDLISLMGAFFVLSFIHDHLESDRLKDFRGLLGKSVAECVCLVLFLACLAGLPPFPGFFGKFALVSAALRHHWYFVSVLVVLSMVISTVAVVRLSFSLVGDFPRTVGRRLERDPARNWVLASLLIPMALIGVFADRLLGLAGQSLQFIFW